MALRESAALRELLGRAEHGVRVLERYLELEDAERSIPILETIVAEGYEPGIEAQRIEVQWSEVQWSEVQWSETLLAQTERWDRLVALYERQLESLDGGEAQKQLRQRIAELRELLA